MISSLSGRISEINEDSLVIELGGLGLTVNAPAPLVADCSPGQQISLQTYLHVRENELSLYGFSNVERRQLFILLLGVNGIGPRLALAILSTLSAEALRSAVSNEQHEILSQVPGVGKKTAQKIVLHLIDRVQPLDGAAGLSGLHEKDADLLQALASLGYTVIESQAAIQSLPKDPSLGLEERLRLALAYFNSPV
jgi:Holliday junction DNA helicase RuvA